MLKDSLQGDARATEQLLKFGSLGQSFLSDGVQTTPSKEEDEALIREMLVMAGQVAASGDDEADDDTSP
ncbi:MAG: hypothetical protein AAFY38_11665 [Pseudomonadota bacterium]